MSSLSLDLKSELLSIIFLILYLYDYSYLFRGLKLVLSAINIDIGIPTKPYQ